MEKLKLTPENGYETIVWNPKSLKTLEVFLNELVDENHKLREAMKFLAKGISDAELEKINIILGKD